MMNRRARRAVSLTTILCSFLPIPALACTDFVVKTNDGGVVAARSMEWGMDLKSRIAIHSRSEKRASRTPEGKTGLSWTSKFGYLGADLCGLDAIVDGVNEKGLSFGLLWCQDYTKFPERKVGDDQKTLDVIDIGSWVLGNFETVDEAKSALEKVVVCATDIPSFGGVPTPHMALHDAKGNSLVVEWLDGKQMIYDNPMGVLTNSPPFDWQTINLRNYLQINPSNPGPMNVAGTILKGPGQGGGFLGIPGDWTPPSRFVRTAAMLKFAKPVSDTESGANLAFHVLNAVDIPKGDIREKIAGQEFTDYTQWALVKDLTGGALLFRSYDNLNLQRLSLKEQNFQAGAPVRYIPIAAGSHWINCGHN